MIDDRSIVRLSVFRPVGDASVVDATLRDEVLPRLDGLDGLVGAWIGRRGADQGHERRLVSVWRSLRLWPVRASFVPEIPTACR